MLASSSVGPFIKFGIVPEGSAAVVLGVDAASIDNIKVWAKIISFFGLAESFRLGFVNKTLQLALKHAVETCTGVFRALRLARRRR